MSPHEVELSKFLSFILRHHPEEIGLTLDEAGWASVDMAERLSCESGLVKWRVTGMCSSRHPTRSGSSSKCRRSMWFSPAKEAWVSGRASDLQLDVVADTSTGAPLQPVTNFCPQLVQNILTVVCRRADAADGGIECLCPPSTIGELLNCACESHDGYSAVY